MLLLSSFYFIILIVFLSVINYDFIILYRLIGLNFETPTT